MPVLFSMMRLETKEVQAIKAARESLTEKQLKDNVKKGVLGGLFGAKK